MVSLDKLAACPARCMNREVVIIVEPTVLCELQLTEDSLHTGYAPLGHYFKGTHGATTAEEVAGRTWLLTVSACEAQVLG